MFRLFIIDPLLLGVDSLSSLLPPSSILGRAGIPLPVEVTLDRLELFCSPSAASGAFDVGRGGGDAAATESVSCSAGGA